MTVLGSHNQSWKIVVCGEGAVGKTTFIETYKQGSFYTGATETVAVEFHSVFLSQMSREENNIPLQIWDLGGQKRYYDMNVFKKYTQEADLAVCCFDINDLETLEEIPRWSEILPSNIPKILVGLKTDLLIEGYSLEDIEEIAEDYKETFDFLSIHLISSKHWEEVCEIIQKIADILSTKYL